MTSKSSRHPMQYIHIDPRGISRFRKNGIVQWLLDSHPSADMSPFHHPRRDGFKRRVRATLIILLPQHKAKKGRG